jgi:hypothetical protein
MRKGLLSFFFLSVGVVALLLISAGGSVGQRVAAQQAPTLQPTETAVPLATPTAVPATTIDVPTVEWADVSIHKQAMKAGFEQDVDKFVKSNRYLIVASLRFEPDAVIRGGVRVRYTNQSQDTLSLIVFRLYPNGPALGGRMNVTGVTVNGSAVEPSFSELRSVMGVPLATPLKSGDAVEVVVQFSTVMAKGLFTSYGRYGYVNDVVSATAWYPTLSVYEPSRGWWAQVPPPGGDPAYTETGLYDVRLTMPADVVAAMSGTIIEQKANSDGTITYRDVTGPMRDHAFQASTRYMITAVAEGGTTINVVHYKDRASDPTDGTQLVAKYSIDSFAAFNRVFGDYPYKEFDIVQNPTPSGVEFPGLVQIAQKAWVKGQPFLEVVVAHEIGHQWFYGLVGNNQVEHPWLDESLTSYTEVVYFRHVYGMDSQKARDHANAFRNQYNGYTGAGQADLPLNLPVRNFFNQAYGAIIYRKGPVFFLELERQLGQEMAYKALNAYFGRFHYQVAVSKDMLNVFEEVSEQQLDELFAQWVGALDADAIPSTRIGYFTT